MPSQPSSDDIVIRLERRDGRPVRARDIDPAEPEDAPALDLTKNDHSPDFASVRWNGQVYGLSPKQRAVVAVLWHAWQDGLPFVSGAMLLEEAESVGARVDDLFRRSEAWGTLIGRGVLYGGAPGTFCLVPAANKW